MVTLRVTLRVTLMVNMMVKLMVKLIVNLVVNLVVWPDMMERYRKVVMGARLIEVRGRVEYDDEVLHVIAAHLEDATGQLQRLASDPLPPSARRTGHPRDVRIIPKSRDFQ